VPEGGARPRAAQPAGAAASRGGKPRPLRTAAVWARAWRWRQPVQERMARRGGRPGAAVGRGSRPGAAAGRGRRARWPAWVRPRRARPGAVAAR
jgi:hypothetical protein